MCVTPPSPENLPILVAWFSGVFSQHVLLHHVENTPPKPADWLVGGGGGRYACGLAWLIFTTAIVFWWFLQTYVTSGQCSCWFLLVIKQWIFWHYLGFQVLAFLCWAAKNSLCGTSRDNLKLFRSANSKAGNSAHAPMFSNLVCLIVGKTTCCLALMEFSLRFACPFFSSNN